MPCGAKKRNAARRKQQLHQEPAKKVNAESLSEDGTASLQEMFKMIETDNSRRIVFEELKAGHERMGANLKESEIFKLMHAVNDESLSEDGTASLEEMFKMIDTDNSRRIVFEELKAGHERMGANLKESEIFKLIHAVIAERLSEDWIPSVREMFKMIDTDNSIQIIFEELKAGLERMSAVLKESKIFELMQAVIKESLSAGLRELFKMIDTDNSIQIIFEEVKAGLERMSAILKESKFFELMHAVIVESLSEDWIPGLGEMFEMIGTDNSRKIIFEVLKAGLERMGANMESEIFKLVHASPLKKMVNIQDQHDQSNGPDDHNDVVTENAAFIHEEPPQDDNGPPKVDSDVEVLLEKVTKQIIKEGYGQKPAKLSTCFLHYRAWVENSLHKFEDTWQEQRPVELILGKEKKEMAGLGIGLSSMKSGERALLHVGWELGYGQEGSFSFPNVPPMADLLYEVELIGFDEAKEGKACSDMTVEERIEAADRRKIQGNEYFRDEKLTEAMQQYEMAIAYMGDDFMFQLFGKYRDMALAVKNPCHLNMAACLIKLKRYEETISQCSIVLSEDENNVKALFRRGKARAELGQTDAAREDFQKARVYAPQDKAIVRELRLLAEHDMEVYQKQKEMYKGIFGETPEPKSKRQLNRLGLLWQWLISLFCRLFKIQREKTD